MSRASTSVWYAVALCAGVIAWLGAVRGAAAEGIPPETVADYIHAVIEADRTFYTMQVVERLQKQGKMVASEDWRIKRTLSLPAQFLKESSELAALTGTKVRYRLIGIWPINPLNTATTKFERNVLAALQEHPERPYAGLVTESNRRFFTAAYADRAVTQACVTCHNADPRTRKQDFKRDDVMGAVVISLPMEP